MNPARWRQITDLFHAALERDAAARPVFLRNATLDDPDLLREIDTLLRSHERTDGFLNEPAWGIAADLVLGEEDSLTGRTLGPYQIGEEIGRGGMGIVYAAEDARLGRTVALKALTPEFTRDPVRRERLTREARAAAALSHPGIATIFALEEIDGELYLVYELVRGRTLREELADGPLPPERLRDTLVVIASALACAHEHGIVHRDLKPENVVRRTDGQIKILDFGIARTPPSLNAPPVTRLTEAGIALGTPGYMAPEQLAGGDVDARADVFAFGVLAWELATAEHPFGAEPAALLSHLTELLEGKTARLSRPLPLPGLDAIARRCLRASPSERYSSTAALLDDLRALEGRPGTPARDVDRDRGGGKPQAALTALGDRLWWWQFHQAVISGINSALPVGVWWVREAIGRPRASAILLMVLGLATVSVALRLNLLFTSRVHPNELFAHRARLFPAIIGADALLATVLLVTAGLLAGTHDGIAAILLCVAISTLASLALIEPTTTRAAGLSRKAKR